MQVTVAKTAGFCFGVRRAVDMVEQAAREEERVVTLGPIIHNRHVVEHFSRMGVSPVDTPEAVMEAIAGWEKPELSRWLTDVPEGELK